MTPAYGGTIDSCTMQYIGTLAKGSQDNFWGPAGAQWAAFEGTNGTGPVATYSNSGNAWSIQ